MSGRDPAPLPGCMAVFLITGGDTPGYYPAALPGCLCGSAGHIHFGLGADVGNVAGAVGRFGSGRRTSIHVCVLPVPKWTKTLV